MNAKRDTHWPAHLASIGGIRFARHSANFAETVRFYRELVGLPLHETFSHSYGSNGAIFGLPNWNLTMEIIEAAEGVPVDPREQICLYFPDSRTRDAAVARLQAAGQLPVEQHSYWAATGALTYRDPDGSEVVFAPFIYGVNEPGDSSASGRHDFP
ncbi:VOC family protein [Mycobacterium vicinigordonae]|uniref:VOC family protein n=1 Tax=Mycobacterium vicinigordonae TaxID=1719132 RepID=A0A7D6IL15_9MYCO|nr:VOC family protein [Mycobacterium vicinigordonae]QLL06680.1 VOC family protein [Mycobacterium vicinigordonae]